MAVYPLRQLLVNRSYCHFMQAGRPEKTTLLGTIIIMMSLSVCIFSPLTRFKHWSLFCLQVKGHKNLSFLAYFCSP